MENYEVLLTLERKLNKVIGKLTEQQLFKLIKGSIFPSMEKVDDKFSRHDCIIKNGGVELKCRRSHYLTLRLQKDKYDHMQQFDRKYYICSTNCGIYIFDLDKIEPKWEETLNPVTTDFYNKEMILKWTYDIPLKQGKNITKRILNSLKNNK